jgi:hypothetical protein
VFARLANRSQKPLNRLPIRVFVNREGVVAAGEFDECAGGGCGVVGLEGRELA